MENLKIEGSTKAFELLEKYPFLKDEILKMGDAFKMIDSPLAKMMFKNATLEDICSKFNLNLPQVIQTLTEMIEKHTA